jgi:hypothetical protein
MQTPSNLATPLSHLQQWILLYLVDREKAGRITKGDDFWLLASDVEPLVDLGYITLDSRM